MENTGNALNFINKYDVFLVWKRIDDSLDKTGIIQVLPEVLFIGKVQTKIWPRQKNTWVAFGTGKAPSA